MPNFTKEEQELETNFDKWLYVIKNLHKLDHIPEKIQERVFQKLYKVAAYTALSKTEKEKYEDSLKYYNDLKNSLDTAHQEGFDEAQSLFETQLLEERRQKEEAQQKLETERQHWSATIHKMHQMGMNIAQIAQLTNRSEADIKQVLIEPNDN
jgi:hypothetical protein